ncbi:MAG: hypothetical protein ACRCXZ_02555, partial [Patescibacteria group bacterium]
MNRINNSRIGNFNKNKILIGLGGSFVFILVAALALLVPMGQQNNLSRLFDALGMHKNALASDITFRGKFNNENKQLMGKLGNVDPAKPDTCVEVLNDPNFLKFFVAENVTKKSSKLSLYTNFKDAEVASFMDGGIHYSFDYDKNLSSKNRVEVKGKVETDKFIDYIIQNAPKLTASEKSALQVGKMGTTDIDFDVTGISNFQDLYLNVVSARLKNNLVNMDIKDLKDKWMKFDMSSGSTASVPTSLLYSSSFNSTSSTQTTEDDTPDAKREYAKAINAFYIEQLSKPLSSYFENETIELIGKNICQSIEKIEVKSITKETFKGGEVSQDVRPIVITFKDDLIKRSITTFPDTARRLSKDKTASEANKKLTSEAEAIEKKYLPKTTARKEKQ